jgi:hypothetical protein
MKQQFTTMDPEFRAAIEEQQQAYDAAATRSQAGEAEYKDAILRLLKLSQSDSSAGEVAAQILLSTYNSYNWHAPLAWFCHLDALNFDAAITVIKGRWSLHAEPHNVIQNGHAIFEDLKKRWPNLPTQG